jgi:hypothetical protein
MDGAALFSGMITKTLRTFFPISEEIEKASSSSFVDEIVQSSSSSSANLRTKSAGRDAP